MLVPLVAQGQDAGFAQVEAAFAQGDAEALVLRSADRVEVTIEGMTTTYSRAQMRYVLAEFFEAHPPEAFAFEHHMGSGEGAAFASGRYRAPGRTFQVMARMGRREGTWELRELRIEP